jgi:hypothetical protein
LKLVNCPQLDRIGNTPILSGLFTLDLPDILISTFPLENLSKLAVDGMSVAVIQNLSRFKTLWSLTVDEKDTNSDFLPLKNELPELKELSLYGFKKIDISNLAKLEALDIGCCQVVIGKEKVYPRLKSLSGNGAHLRRTTLDNTQI